MANGGSSDVTAVFGNGKGQFSIGANYATGYTIPGIPDVSAVMGDFNGDGKLDLAVANNGSNTVSVMINLGGGQFAATTVLGEPSSCTRRALESSHRETPTQSGTKDEI